MPTGPGSVPVDDHEYDEGWAAFDRGDWTPGEIAGQSASFLAGFRAAAEDHGDPRENTEATPPPAWQDTPEQVKRLGDLEMRVLYGTRTDAELTEYRELAAAHEAWLVLQPQFWAWVDEQEARTGIPHAPEGVERPPGC